MPDGIFGKDNLLNQALAEGENGEFFLLDGRGGRIRTGDFLLPKQAR